MQTTVVAREPFKLVGVGVRTSNAAEMQPGTGKIAGVWRRFFEEKLEDKITSRIHPELLFGVYTDYESDVNGVYNFILGCEVANLDNIPEGFTGVVVPGGKYLRFVASGPMPEAVIKEWLYIWKFFLSSRDFERAYTADYEEYNKNSPSEVNIYIAVK